MNKFFTTRRNGGRFLGAFGSRVLLATLVFGMERGSRLVAEPVDGRVASENQAVGLRAFADVAAVIRSPRCSNCHPAGDVPRQTDQQQPHFPAVARGPDGHGITGMRCNACHQDANQPNGVPGAPHWSLAPRSMAWAGLGDRELAEQLKDPNRNGHRTLVQMIEHVSTEPLVLWAWEPGGGRLAPPLTHEQFVQRFTDWVAAGAPSPQSRKE
jgi:hypothetical protein